MRITGVRVIAVLVGLAALGGISRGLPLAKTHALGLDNFWALWGLGALVCAVGLWRLQRWAVWLFDALALTNLALFAVREQQSDPAPWPVLLLVLVLVGGVFAAVSLYLDGQLKRRLSSP